MTITQHKTHYWIPSVYILQGLPYALVTAFAPVLYKEYGLSNSKIAFYTSLFTLPWILKFFFSPALEHLSTKKTIVLNVEFLLAFFTLLLIIPIIFPTYFYLTSILFVLIAIASSVHDISVDGLYLERLDLRTQAKFIGVRSIFYRIGQLFCQGGMIYLAGIFTVLFSKEIAWSITCFILTITVLSIALFNIKMIPTQQTPQSANTEKCHLMASYKKVWHALINLPHIYATVIFVVLYGAPEAQLIKILPLFMLDSTAQGGLNLSIAEVGVIYGVINSISILTGITLSGFLLNKFGLKKCFVPLTILAMLSNSSYFILQWYALSTFWQIALCVIIAQFCYGLCNGAYMLYLIQRFAKGEYSMSLYAISTACMLFGMMLAGSIAGFIQNFLGYTGFFIWIILFGISMILLTIYNMGKSDA